MATKPTKRVTKTIKISIQMTEARAERFDKMLDIFIQAIKLQPYPNEYLSEAKGDYIDKESDDGR